MPGGIDSTGAAVRWGHGVRGHRRRRLGVRGLSRTQGAMRLVRQAFEGFGLVGVVALRFEGLGLLSWRGWSRHWALGPSEVQDEEPEECEQDELRENMMRDHGVAPSNMS